MPKKKSGNRFRLYQAIKQSRRNIDLSAYEEHLGRDFFAMVGRNAATNAINENKAMKLPVTLVKNGWVVREMPDGSQERISEIHVIPSSEFRERKLTKGAVIHVGRKH